MTPDQIREVFRQALRDGDLHEDCTLCQERIDAAIAGVTEPAGLVVAYGDGHDVRLEIVPPAAVWVVVGHIDYEGDDIQSVHADEHAAQAECVRLSATGRGWYSSYTVERYEVK